MSLRYQQGKTDPFEEDSALLEADAEIYGRVEVPTSGRLVAKPVALESIRPDPRQPRRGIPLAVRGQWDGNFGEVADVLTRWLKLAEREVKTIPVERLLRGDETAFFDPKTEIESGLALDLLDLFKLASSIHLDGLDNPISVISKGSGYLIESGERRWLAYCALALWVDSKYDRIPAFVKTTTDVDVWRQAAENGARRPLNAIGMARQIALLVMDLYRGSGSRGTQFDDYDELVAPGECDRRFYAQVRDGVQYPIPRGMGQRILDVTGLKSKKQVADYRALLSIPDGLWVEADVGNWAEGRIREVNDALKRQERQAEAQVGKRVNDERRLPIGNLHENAMALNTPEPASMSEPTGDPEINSTYREAWRDELTETCWILYEDGWWQIIAIDPTGLVIRPADGESEDLVVSRRNPYIIDWMTDEDWRAQNDSSDETDDDFDDDDLDALNQQRREADEAAARAAVLEATAPLRDEWQDDYVSLLRLLERVARRRGMQALEQAVRYMLNVSPEVIRRSGGMWDPVREETVRSTVERHQREIVRACTEELTLMARIAEVGIVAVIDEMKRKYGG